LHWVDAGTRKPHANSIAPSPDSAARWVALKAGSRLMARPGSSSPPPLGRFPAPMIEKHYRQAQRREAERPVDEAGGGEAEGFEMAEE